MDSASNTAYCGKTPKEDGNKECDGAAKTHQELVQSESIPQPGDPSSPKLDSSNHEVRSIANLCLSLHPSPMKRKQLIECLMKLQEQIDELKAKDVANQKKITSLLDQNATSQGQIQALQSKNKELKDEIDVLRLNNQVLQDQVHDLYAKNQQLEVSNKALQDQVHDLNAKNQQLEVSNKDLRDQVRSMIAKNKQLEKTIEVVKSEVEILKMNNDCLKAEHRKVAAKVYELEFGRFQLQQELNVIELAMTESVDKKLVSPLMEALGATAF